MFVVLATLGLLFIPKYRSSHLRNARTQQAVGAAGRLQVEWRSTTDTHNGFQEVAGTVIQRGSGNDPLAPAKQTESGTKEHASERPTHVIKTLGTAARITKLTRNATTTTDDDLLPGTVESPGADGMVSSDTAAQAGELQSVQPVRPGEKYAFPENPMSELAPGG